MNVNILNIYLCIAAPLLLAIILLKKEVRQSFVFLFAGMTICLVCGYINSYLQAVFGLDSHEAVIMLTPITEEFMKALPVLLLVLVFSQRDDQTVFSAIACGVGFAALENCAYLLLYGADNVAYVLIRGFATGIMHGGRRLWSVVYP